MLVDTVPIQIIDSQTRRACLAEIEISIDGEKKNFLLDTGAASSSVATDAHTKEYPRLGTGNSSGNLGSNSSL